MKRIICGTDFSVHAAEAANVAAALAVRHNALLTLVHAAAPEEVQRLDSRTRERIRNDKRRQLIAEGSRLRAFGAQVLERLVFGAPHELLVTEARRVGADLIVVASLGQVSAMRWLAGSVALRTAQKATVPTLVVRDYRRLLAWATGERPLNVFACYDFSPTSDAALRWIASFQKWGPCNVTVTYVSWPPQESWRLGMSENSAEDNGSNVQFLLKRGIREKCERLLTNVETNIHVVSTWNRPDVHLNELANITDADVVVVGANHRNAIDRLWTGSVSRGVIRHSRTNVVCVPGNYVPREIEHDSQPTTRSIVPIHFGEGTEEAEPIAFEAANRERSTAAAIAD